MADNGSTESHKNSKSLHGFSLLHRDKSKSEQPEQQLDDAGSIASSSPTTASHGFGSLRHSRSKQTGESSKELESAATGIGTMTRPSQETQTSAYSGGTTIEESVRTFKVFEVLRSGNKEAVSQAILAEAEKSSLKGTTILHLAVQCADPSIVAQVLSNTRFDVNAQDRDGNTPLHLASMLGRVPLVQLLLASKNIDGSVGNYEGKSPLDLARTPDIFQELQLNRAMFMEAQVHAVQRCIETNDYENLEKIIEDSKFTAVLDVNAMELVTDPVTLESGGTLLHEASRKKDMKLVQLLLLNGADPFRRDRRGKLPQDVTKDDRTKAILKKSPAATAAQRGIQEKAILGSHTTDKSAGGKESREIKGYLKKWTNYTSGYKLRWFVLEDGVLSYYKHQDDAGSACRGAMNMRIAKLSMDAQDKTRFEIQGKSSIKYHLRANHTVEAKRWFWALNNSIQWAKDEARGEQQRKDRESDATRQAISNHKAKDSLSSTVDISKLGGKSLVPASAVGISTNNTSRASFKATTDAPSSIGGDDLESAYGSYEPYTIINAPGKSRNTVELPGELDDDEEYGDDASSHELRPIPKDAFNITAHSADLQLDILAGVSRALQKKMSDNPETPVSDTEVQQAVSTYETAVQSIKSLVGDLLKISRDRDAYWQYRVDREVDMRRLWEESMAKVAHEQEALEGRIGESEEKRKRTKKALREALEEGFVDPQSPPEQGLPSVEDQSIPSVDDDKPGRDRSVSTSKRPLSRDLRRKSTIAALTELSDSDSDADEEFFDAVGAGSVRIEEMPTSPIIQSPKTGSESKPPVPDSQYEEKSLDMMSSFVGYEDPLRKRLKLDADDRPKISLWGILKSMIGKDMTKMTLPVSFNEPTSLLQRVAEDMEYTDLLDTAAERQDSTERMVYVAAFAASEYASTIGRVAKPFNPLLGETYEYARPDKGFRFFIEQVSHHPPIGAAWAESSKWDYYGESAVNSKFYGKSFDINPLGTWFLKIRPTSGGEELYTWKKVTSSVIGIITGSPTVDNYGLMEVKNWTTGDVCQLNFKPRGWKASSAYQVNGKVVASDGGTRWSMGGRWNDKIFARLTPGFEAAVEASSEELRAHEPGSSKAFLVWKAHTRPSGIPFNLTPFGVTLNALPDKLRPCLPPTDTRLRPDQRAMEDGEYDFAATEKSRVEDKQRAKRREREAGGEEFVPRWFRKGRCEISGEEYWVASGEYWRMRQEVVEGGKWQRVEDIF